MNLQDVEPTVVQIRRGAALASLRLRLLALAVSAAVILPPTLLVAAIVR